MSTTGDSVPSRAATGAEPMATGRDEEAEAKPCRWCRLVGSKLNVVADEGAFIVLEPGTERAGTYLTLMPKAHVGVMSELPAAQMASVLAGLASASGLLRQAAGVVGVRVQPYPKVPRDGGPHLRFRLVPELAACRKPGKTRTGRLSVPVSPMTLMDL